MDLVRKMLSIPDIYVKPSPPGVEVRFTCSICREVYSWKSVNPMKLVEQVREEVVKCSKCGRWVHRSCCWNYRKGVCVSCEPLKLPEFVVEKKLLRTEYYVVCSLCRSRIGPISELDKEKAVEAFKAVAKLGLGTALALPSAGVPLLPGKLIGSGILDLARALKGERRLALRDHEKALARVLAEIAQCPVCER